MYYTIVGEVISIERPAIIPMQSNSIQYNQNAIVHIWSEIEIEIEIKININNWITCKMVSDIVLNPLPLIVISRNLAGNLPAISLRKSVAVTVLKLTLAPDTIFCGSGALIHKRCKFGSWDMIDGILNSGRLE